MSADAAAARVLVVDDQEHNRDLLSRRLRADDHDVDVAEDGPRALAMLAVGAYDLVLLDVMMPGMDGYGVLARIKASESLRHLPVIMVSALDETESVVRCLELGADDYLTKPFNALVLRARVDASLARKWLHDREQIYAKSLARELEIGREIQQGFLPQSCPALGGWEIAARFEPARSVAGDFYDAYVLPNGHVALVVADVCDKGVGAALYMALFRSLLRALAGQAAVQHRPDDALLAEVTAHTSDYIATVHDRANMFATTFFAILDPVDGRLHYVNAGHDPPFLAGSAGSAGEAGTLRRLGATGPALGLVAGARYEVRVETVAPDEVLLVYTDGVSDARAVDGTQFSDERIAALLGDRVIVAGTATGADAAIDARAASGMAPDGCAAQLLDRIAAAVAAHAGAGDRFDDATMLAVHRVPPGAPAGR
ncbi:MAG TPA: SpoIIE family protein phosphatase [Casimicrobiaceae bacterium]